MAVIHQEPHPFAHKTVRIKEGIKHPQVPTFGGSEFRLEDWWDKINGESWMDSVGNMAALIYAVRSGMADLPCDDEVVYGKVGSFGHLVHVSELELEPVPAVV